MRLTNIIREKIRTKMVDKKFAERRKKLEQLETNVALEFYRLSFDNKSDFQNAMTSNNGVVLKNTFQIYTNQYKRVLFCLPESRKTWTTANTYFCENDLHGERKAVLDKYLKYRMSLEKDIEALERKIDAVTYACTTVKALKTHWENASDIIDSCLPDYKPSAPLMLTPIVSQLDAELELP